MPRPPKPITIRIKRDARDFLPAELADLADEANWLQDRVIRFGAMGRTRRDYPTFVPLKMEYIEREIGWRAAGRLLPWLLETGMMESTPNYFVGRWAYGYRLGPQFNDRPTHQLLLTNPDLIRKIRAVERKNEKAWGIEWRHLKFWANKVGMNLAKASAILQFLPTKCQTSAIECMAAISAGRTFVCFCEFGRAHTAVTRLKRELRPSLTFDGRPLISIDIANSQPLILGATMRHEIVCGAYDWRSAASKNLKGDKAKGQNGGSLKGKASSLEHGPQAGTVPHSRSARRVGLRPPQPRSAPIRSPDGHENAHKFSAESRVTTTEFCREMPNDLELFMRLCEQGGLYEFLMRESGWAGTRSAWKDRVWFRFFYGCPKSPTWNPRPDDDYKPTPEEVTGLRALVVAFKRHFPNVDRWIRHKKPWRREGELSKAMQRVESKIVIGGVVGALARTRPEVPFVTIHDSFLMLPEHEPLLRDLLVEEFDKWGVRPNLKTENYRLPVAA